MDPKAKHPQELRQIADRAQNAENNALNSTVDTV